MGKFKNILQGLGEIADDWAAAHQKIEELTDQLVKRTYDVDRAEARKIASMLIRDADPIVWKR